MEVVESGEFGLALKDDFERRIDCGVVVSCITGNWALLIVSELGLLWFSNLKLDLKKSFDYSHKSQLINQYKEMKKKLIVL